MNYLAEIAINNSKPMHVNDSLKIPYKSKMAVLRVPTIIKIIYFLKWRRRRRRKQKLCNGFKVHRTWSFFRNEHGRSLTHLATRHAWKMDVNCSLIVPFNAEKHFAVSFFIQIMH